MTACVAREGGREASRSGGSGPGGIYGDRRERADPGAGAVRCWKPGVCARTRSSRRRAFTVAASGASAEAAELAAPEPPAGPAGAGPGREQNHLARHAGRRGYRRWAAPAPHRQRRRGIGRPPKTRPLQARRPVLDPHRLAPPPRPPGNTPQPPPAPTLQPRTAHTMGKCARRGRAHLDSAATGVNRRASAGWRAPSGSGPFGPVGTSRRHDEKVRRTGQARRLRHGAPARVRVTTDVPRRLWWCRAIPLGGFARRQ